MPLINPHAGRIESVRHICRLQRPNGDALMAYARFIGDIPDHVLNALIGATLLKDREFLDWQVGRARRTQMRRCTGHDPINSRRITDAEVAALMRPAWTDARAAVSLAGAALVGVFGLQLWLFP